MQTLMIKIGNFFFKYRNLLFIPSPQTFESMQFNWRRWLAKEYNTQFVWLLGLTFILLFKYPELSDYDTVIRNHWLLWILPALTLFYCSIRYLKKSKKLYR